MSAELESLIVELDAKTKKYNSDMKAAAAKSQSSLNKIQKALDKTAKKQRNVTKTTEQFKLSTLAAGISVGLVTRQIFAYSDTYTNLSNKMRVATQATGNMSEATDKLFEIANKTRSSVDATVDLFTRMERSTRKLGIEQSRLLKVTEVINKAFQVGGASTQEATSAIRQLGQAFASGALRGDEFRSIAENAPLLMEAIAESTGKTKGELRDLAAQGVITSEVIIKSLENYADKIDSDFVTANISFAQSFEVATNNAIKFVGENEKLQSIVKNSGSAIIFLSENLDVMAKAAEVLAVILFARLGSSLTLSIAKMIGLDAASRKAAGGLLTAATGARIFSGALSLVGGPLGLALIAASSLAIFVSQQSDVEKATEKATKKIDDQIKSLGGLSRAALNSTSIDTQEKILKISKERAKQLEIIFNNQKKIDDENSKTSLLRGTTTGFEQNRDAAREKLKALDAELEANKKLQKAIVDLKIKADAQLNEEEKKKIDLDNELNRKKLEQDEERRKKQLARSRQNRLDSIEQRQKDFEAESETQITALEERLQDEQDLVDAAEETNLITHEEALKKKFLLEEEFRLRLLKLGENDLERLQNQNDLELEQQQQLLDQKLINEERYLFNVERINRKNVEQKIKLSQKEAREKAGLDNLTLKFSVQALETFGKKNEKAARAAFEIKRLQKLSEAVVNTSSGITAALPNFPLAIAVGLAGAAEIATIASQSFEGGGSGKSSVSEPAVQEETKPADTTVNQNLEVDQTIQGRAGTQSGEFNLRFTADSGDEIGEAMASLINNAVKNGRVDGET